MKRRDFSRTVLGALVGVAAFGVAGCEEYGAQVSYAPYDYLYYWDANVYYHPHSQIYFYVSQGRWIRSRRPPPGLPRRWTRLVIRDGAPYYRNHEHRSWYRRGRAGRYDRYGRDRYDRPTRRPQQQPPSQAPRKPRPGAPRDTFDKRPGEEWPDYHERKRRERRGERPQPQPPSQPPRPGTQSDTLDKRPGEEWPDYHERKKRERRGERPTIPNWRRVLGTDTR